MIVFRRITLAPLLWGINVFRNYAFKNKNFDDFGESDPDFDAVLTRSPSVFGIFAIQN